MAHRSDLRVRSVDAGLPAALSGMKKGDVIVSVNERPVSDEFDFRFNAARDLFTVRLIRGGKRKRLVVTRPANALLGVHFVQRPVRRCANRCIFCFIDQMPGGLRRKSLYVKDEDIGHSFTNGNYVTLSSTPYEELERIAGIGLSPIFVSVHATDNAVRRRMLGNPRAFDIMEQLRFLAKNDVSFHAQIVVCPGFNDGMVLRRSVHDILSLGTGLLSLAIVPVGLTKHRKLPLNPVTSREATAIISVVSDEGEIDKERNGGRRLFCADELFIKAGIPIPARSYYEDYPQIGNGVGLVRQLLDEWKSVKRTLHPREGRRRSPKRLLLVTSESAAGFLARIASDINKAVRGVRIETCTVKNVFFGDLVTVAGLLTSRDIIRAVRMHHGAWDRIVLPAVAFNYQGFTLDGYSKTRLERELEAPVTVTGSLKTLVSLF